MLKQTLLAFTVLGFAGSAAAADITNPFFLPKAGHVSSVTSFEFARDQQKAKGDLVEVQGAGNTQTTIERVGAKNDTSYTRIITEQLQFGILNNLAVIGSVQKYWGKEKDLFALEPAEKYHNDLDWTAGLAWNVLSCNTKLQLSSVYGQDDPGVKGTYKFFDTTVKLGYQFKTWLPYATFTVHTPVAQTKEDHTDRWSYNGKVGVYQGKCGVWALDTALAWSFDRTDDHERTLSAEAEASYYLTKNMTLGVYGSYVLDGKAKDQTDVSGETVGARLRLYF